MIERQSRYIASLFLTARCDLACQFCGSDNTFSAGTLPQAIDLLNALKSTGFTQVVLGGGEPLLWPHTFELASKARQMGFLVQLCSNGVKLDQLSELPVDVDRFILPIESLIPKKHNRLRRSSPTICKDHHRVLLSLIEKMTAADKEVTFSTVVSSQNHTELMAMSNWMRELSRNGTRIHAWHLYKFLPVGRGGARHQHAFEIDMGTFMEAVGRVQGCHEDFAVYRRPDMYNSKTVAYFCSDGTTFTSLAPPPGDQYLTAL